jgi:hypothetical protein
MPAQVLLQHVAKLHPRFVELRFQLPTEQPTIPAGSTMLVFHIVQREDDAIPGGNASAFSVSRSTELVSVASAVPISGGRESPNPARSSSEESTTLSGAVSAPGSPPVQP